MNVKKYLQVLISAVLFSSCHPTSLLQSGTTQFYENQKPNNFMVVAFTGEVGDVVAFEKIASNKISAGKGFDSKPGHEVLKSIENLPKDLPGLRKLAIEQGYNGMVEIKLVSIRKESTSTEADYPTRREYRIMDVANYGKLVQEYGKREEKGANFEDTKVKMEWRLLDLSKGEGQVIWSCRTEIVNPRTSNQVANGLTNKAMKSMKKQGILP